MSYCKVSHCNHPKSHTTIGHKCGKCHNYGHGQIECGDIDKINKLSLLTSNIPEELQCCIKNCMHKSSHTISGHQCINCKKFAHDITECPEKKYYNKSLAQMFGQTYEGYLEKQNLKFTAREILGSNKNKIYTVVYAGMGCSWFAKRKDVYKKIKLFFMHSDEWGQYGAKSSNVPNLEKFLKDYKQIEPVI